MIFIVYAFFAARHVGKETVLTSKWLYSLETNYPSVQNEGDFFPFQLG